MRFKSIRIYWSWCFLLALGASLQAQAYPYRLAPEFPYQLEDMMELIETENITSIEELLPALPAEFRERYLLMHRSRSLQQSSPTHPRVIMIGGDASFVLTFNGDPLHRGYENLEMMQFRPETQSFEFRELSFRNGRARLSEANPSKCLRCHQSPTRSNVDPRPNWEPYNNWPGGYGAHDGRIQSSITRSLEIDFGDNPADHIILEEAAVERQRLNRFESEIKPTHPRYKYLGRYQPDLMVRVTQYFANLNFRRVGRLLSELPHWDHYKWPLLAVTRQYRCRTSHDLPFPEWVIELHEPSFRELTGLSPEEELDLHGAEDIIEFITLPLGIDSSDWSMDFRTDGRFAFSERFGTPNFPRADFNRNLMAIFPEFQDADCKKIEAQVETAFTNLSQDLLAAEIQAARLQREQAEIPRPAPEILSNTCARCHSGANEEPLSIMAPVIPFHNLTQLASRLNEGEYARGNLRQEIIYRINSHASIFEQMPPDRALSQEETQLLTEFISSL